MNIMSSSNVDLGNELQKLSEEKLSQYIQESKSTISEFFSNLTQLPSSSHQKDENPNEILKHDPISETHVEGNVWNLFSQVMSNLAQSPDVKAFTFESHLGKPDLSYKEFLDKIDRIAALLAQAIEKCRPNYYESLLQQNQTVNRSSQFRPPRILPLITFNEDFFAAACACFKVGASLVILDPEMERKKLASCVHQVEPDILITNFSSPKLFFTETLIPTLKRIPITLKLDSEKIRNDHFTLTEKIEIPGDQEALITFTTGSTGTPKPIIKSHDFIKVQCYTISESILMKETRILSDSNDSPYDTCAKESLCDNNVDSEKSIYSTLPPSAVGKVVCTNLPTFILAFLSWGCTIFMPSTLKISKLSSIHSPDLISLYESIQRHQIHYTVFSPGFVTNLILLAEKRKEKLSFQELIVGGAPIFKKDINLFSRHIEGKLWIVYGSSEAEPMAMVSASERLVLETVSSIDHSPIPDIPHAILLGHDSVVKAGKVEIAKFIEDLRNQDYKTEVENVILDAGFVGEIIASGPHVHTIYPERLLLATDGQLFLRTGDSGFKDTEGRIWLLGRTAWAVRSPSLLQDNNDTSSAQNDSTFVSPYHRYWSTSAERIILEKFPEKITFAVYCFHQQLAILFLEAPKGTTYELRCEILSLLGEFSIPVDEMRIRKKIPRDKRHASKPNMSKLLKTVQKSTKPDEKIVYERHEEEDGLETSLFTRIGNWLSRGRATAHLDESKALKDSVISFSTKNSSNCSFQEEGIHFEKSNQNLNFLFCEEHSLDLFQKYGGGKAFNLARLHHFMTDIQENTTVNSIRIPDFFCISTNCFDNFIESNHLSHIFNVKLPSKESPDENWTTRVESHLNEFYKQIRENILAVELPSQTRQSLYLAIQSFFAPNDYVAVRSSGADEDSTDHSFAGQFESFMYVPSNNLDCIIEKIKLCWISCFSPRVMLHRLECGLPISEGIRMAVIIQKMVNSKCAGVAFSRHPLKPVSTHHVLIESVWGQGEGLVGGTIEPDSFEFDLKSNQIVESTIVEQENALLMKSTFDNQKNCDGEEIGGLELVSIALQDYSKQPCLSDLQCKVISQFASRLENHLGCPQDIEWAYDQEGKLYCLQTRPIATLPLSSFFKKIDSPQGNFPILWDNSNIVESYSGVTTPFTFSFASSSYEQAYIIMLNFLEIPPSVIEDNRDALKNLLGLVRGRIYYNLMNWYTLLSLIPMGQFGDPKYMDTMMGVKQGVELSKEISATFERILTNRPQYKTTHAMKVQLKYVSCYRRIDKIVQDFFSWFNPIYEKARKMNFEEMGFQECVAYYRYLHKHVLGGWWAPLVNDFLVMAFFGTLKKLTAKMLSSDEDDPDEINVNGHVMKDQKLESLQNDLLCGQGDVESAEPTKMLMSIAQWIDSIPKISKWFVENTSLVTEELIKLLKRKPIPQEHQIMNSAQQIAKSFSQDALSIFTILNKFLTFLDRFGFRCVNELKLEERTLLDDPQFVVDAVSGYIKTKSYNIKDMDRREQEIRENAENVVKEKFSGAKLKIFMWVLRATRKVTKHRENLRFARTKIFGVVRSLVRGMGSKLFELGLLDDSQDVFYLTIEELLAFADGRSVSTNFKQLVQMRKMEFKEFNATQEPPERFMTTGAAGAYMVHPQILNDLDLLKHLKIPSLDHPNMLMGVSCCPGVVEGVARVVKDLSEAKGLNGEILITARTDPGWVPLYPLCKALLIERGSLLSHSAVVARELGLPTIVGISGGLMTRIKTGMKLKVDATRGIVEILEG